MSTTTTVLPRSLASNSRALSVRLTCSLCALVAITACQPLGSLFAIQERPDDLLQSAAFFDREMPTLAPTITPLTVDDAMRDFVAEDIQPIKMARARVNRLIKKLGENGYYADNYDLGLTQNAAQTFASKQGNCLSYTHMFIALAREAGLDARYELVKGPLIFSASKGVLEHQVHIRVHVVLPSGMKYIQATPHLGAMAHMVLPSRTKRERFMIVDFNLRRFDSWNGTLVSDKFARSLHHSNDAVEHWRTGNDAEAFARMVKAIELAPNHSDHWANLATFYTRRGKHEQALRINRYALALDPRNMVALAGVVQIARGAELDKAKNLLKQRRANNAYYHFALAQRATYYAQYAEALTHIARSLRLNKRNHEFFELRGEVLKNLKNYEAARDSYQNALNLAKSISVKRRYRTALLEVEQLIADSA